MCGGSVFGSPLLVDAFLVGVSVATGFGLIVLLLYLWWSDGPVFAADGSVVED